MNNIIENDIAITKEFHQRLSAIYKLGGRNGNIYAKVRALIGGIKEEGERLFLLLNSNPNQRFSTYLNCHLPYSAV